MVNKSELSSAALAYLGDSVIELCVREYLVNSGISDSKTLNIKALGYVRAEAQAQAMKKIRSLLDDEEAAVFRRGRNIGHTNTPKNATAGQYREATGMEALFGYLHLTGRKERIAFLFESA